MTNNILPTTFGREDGWSYIFTCSQNDVILSAIVWVTLTDKGIFEKKSQTEDLPPYFGTFSRKLI